MRNAERDTAILNAIREKPRTISEIVEATSIPESPVKRRVRNLEKRGSVVHNPDGAYSIPSVPTSPVDLRPSLPGGIGRRPYTDSDLRRDAMDRFLDMPTREDRLMLLLAKVHGWEIEAEDLERAGNRERARQLRNEVTRLRKDLSAMYGIDLVDSSASKSSERV